MMIGRRSLLQGISAGAGGAMLPLGRFGAAFAVGQGGGPRLIVIMLRGAVDGLNVVVPYADRDYAALRPSIGIAAPGGAEGALSLDGYFGLHPALASLQPLWQEKRLAFVQACGSPDPTRSHFDAQTFMENGTPGRAMTPDGWMNRLVGVLPGGHGTTTAISLGATSPHILAGPQPATNFTLGPNASKPLPIDRPAVAAAFAQLYDRPDAMGEAFRNGQSARRELVADLDDANPLTKEQKLADNGAPPPSGFPAVAGQLARLMVRDDRVRLAFVDLGGWDTHVSQGGAKGQLANHLAPLGDGLAALSQGLGRELDNTTILVMSEFGRTARENGNGGTDHGHGNVMWVAGGKVAGGRLYGDWPGLQSAALYEGRDLAITTDFRDVIGTVLQRHLRLSDAALSKVMPAMPHDTKMRGLIQA